MVLAPVSDTKLTFAIICCINITSSIDIICNINIISILNILNLLNDVMNFSTGLRNLLEPWSRAARKWRESEERKKNGEKMRKQRENEEI